MECATLTSKAEDAAVGAKGQRVTVEYGGTLARQHPKERSVQRRGHAGGPRARQKGSDRQRARADDRRAVASVAIRPDRRPAVGNFDTGRRSSRRRHLPPGPEASVSPASRCRRFVPESAPSTTGPEGLVGPEQAPQITAVINAATTVKYGRSRIIRAAFATVVPSWVAAAWRVCRQPCGRLSPGQVVFVIAMVQRRVDATLI